MQPTGYLVLLSLMVAALLIAAAGRWLQASWLAGRPLAPALALQVGAILLLILLLTGLLAGLGQRWLALPGGLNFWRRDLLAALAGAIFSVGGLTILFLIWRGAGLGSNGTFEMWLLYVAPLIGIGAGLALVHGLPFQPLPVLLVCAGLGVAAVTGLQLFMARGAVNWQPLLVGLAGSAGLALVNGLVLYVGWLLLAGLLPF